MYLTAWAGCPQGLYRQRCLSAQGLYWSASTPGVEPEKNSSEVRRGTYALFFSPTLLCLVYLGPSFVMSYTIQTRCGTEISFATDPPHSNYIEKWDLDKYMLELFPLFNI